MSLFPSPADAPLLARVAAGLLGAVLMLRGARLYRVAVIAPGVLLGGAAGGLGAAALGLGPPAEAVAAVAVAVVGGVACSFAEAVAVRLAGVFVGAGLAQVWPGAPWWAALVGALAGLLVFPAIWRALLPLLTAAMGTLAVAWAAGHPASPALLVGGTVLGALIQWSFRRDADDDHSKR